MSNSLRIPGLMVAALLVAHASAFSQIRTAPRMNALGVFRTKGDWEHAYHGFIAKAGFRTSGAAWEGYCRLGRGAVYVTKESRAKSAAAEGGVQQFVPIARLSHSLVLDSERSDMQEIVRRIDSYDPEKEFVVIFEADGITGVDVLKPTLPPCKVAQTVAYKKCLTMRP